MLGPRELIALFLSKLDYFHQHCRSSLLGNEKQTNWWGGWQMDTMTSCLKKTTVLRLWFSWNLPFRSFQRNLSPCEKPWIFLDQIFPESFPEVAFLSTKKLIYPSFGSSGLMSVWTRTSPDPAGFGQTICFQKSFFEGAGRMTCCWWVLFILVITMK